MTMSLFTLRFYTIGLYDRLRDPRICIESHRQWGTSCALASSETLSARAPRLLAGGPWDTPEIPEVLLAARLGLTLHSKVARWHGGDAGSSEVRWSANHSWDKTAKMQVHSCIVITLTGRATSILAESMYVS